MENRAIETIYKMQISKKDLDLLPEDVAAALAITSLAATECFVFMRLHVDAHHAPSGDDDIDLISLTHHLAIQRSWSAKLFEYWEFAQLSGFNKTSCSDLSYFMRDARAEFEGILNGEGYDIARDMRNEISNHYSLKAARKNLKFTSNSSVMPMILHEKTGNSYYTMGEVVMFLGRLNISNSTKGNPSLSDAINSWHDWNIQASLLVEKINYRMITRFLLPKIDGRRGVKRKPYIPYEMIGDTAKPTSPVLFRRDGK